MMASVHVMDSLVKTLTNAAVIITSPTRLVLQPLVTLLIRALRYFNFFRFNGEQPILSYEGFYNCNPAPQLLNNDVVLSRGFKKHLYV